MSNADSSIIRMLTLIIRYYDLVKIGAVHRLTAAAVYEDVQQVKALNRKLSKFFVCSKYDQIQLTLRFHDQPVRFDHI